MMVSTLTGFLKLLIFGYYVYSFYIGTIYIEKGMPNPCKGGSTYTVADLLSALIALMTGMMMVF